MNDNRFTRKKLYELVWSTPLTTLEKIYDIPANEIRSICKRHEIPLPKSGHWMKVKFGLEVKRDPLPDNPNAEQNIVLRKEEKQQKQKEKPATPAKQEVLQKEIVLPDEEQPKKQEIMVVPERLANPDPLIELTKKVLTIRESRNWDALNTVTANKALNIRVSSGLIPRSLRLMDTILKIFRSRGYKIRTEHSKTLLTIGETEMEISLREKQKRELIKGKYSWQTAEYHPSGLLVFQARVSYRVTEWTEGKSSLENQLSKIITSLESKARAEQEYMQSLRIHWAKMEKEQQTKAEIKKRKTDELEAFRELFKEVERYRQAKVIRDYADELEKDIAQSSAPEEIVNKIEWIRKKADWFDPFINAPDELLDGFNKDEIMKA